MKSEFLINKQNKNLILFFNGFAMEKEYFKHLSSNSDVLMFWNYNNLNLNLKEIDLSKYEKTHILCFSLGVWVFSVLQENVQFNGTLTVVNGTTKPIDENYGIAPEIFKKTYENFNNAGRLKFFKRMCKDKESFQRLTNLTKTKVEIQKKELKFLMDKILMLPEKKLNPNKVIVSEKDRIFPSNNQKKYWKDFKLTILNNEGHFPFFHFNSFEEIINI